MDLPLVSVIVPAYNAEAFIERTLESVLAQTYPHLEILVINDGSTDRTAAIVTRLAQQDSRLRILEQPNAGVAAARNHGIQAAQGEYIAPIDADDIWYPQNIEKQVDCLRQADPTVGVVYSWSLDIDEAELALGGFSASTIAGDVYKTLLCHNFLGNASATLIRRSCLETVGFYDTRLRELGAQGCEDWDLYLRLAERYQFQVVPEFLVGYRKVLHSMSRNYEGMARSQDLMLQFAQERCPETSGLLYRLSKSSFYLYLAKQSRQHQCYRGTLFWLNRALQVDAITPMFRLALYSLMIESIVRLTIKEFAAWIGPDNYYWKLLKRWAKASLPQSSGNVENLTFSIRAKRLIEHLLHRSLPSLF